MKFLLILIIFLFASLSVNYSQITDEWIRVDSTYLSTSNSTSYYIRTELLSNFSDKIIYYNLEQPGYMDKDFNRSKPKLFLKYSSNGGSSWYQCMERDEDCSQCYIFWYSLCTPSENKIVLSEDSAEYIQYYDNGIKKEFCKRHARLLISDDRGSTYRFIYFDSNTVITDINMVDENRGTCFLSHLSTPLYENTLKKDEILYTNDGWITYKNIYLNDSTLNNSHVHFLSDGKMVMQVYDTINKKRFIYYSLNDGLDWYNYELKIDKKLTLEKIISENVLFFIYSDSLQATWVDYIKILRTNDRCNNFDTVWKKNIEYSYYFFECYDSTNYILCYNNNNTDDFNFYILKTTNSGVNWDEQYFHTQVNGFYFYKPMKLNFIDKNLIYVRTDGGGLTPGTNIFKYTGNKTLNPILPIITGKKNTEIFYKTDSVLVSWNKIENAESYYIEVNGISLNDFNDHLNLIERRIHNVISTNVTDTSIWLTNLNKYYYYTAIGKSQNSTMTSIEGEAYFKTEGGNLNIPQFIYPDSSIKGYYTIDSILIKWSSVTDAESYDLAITYNNSKFWENIPILSIKGTTDTSYLLKGLLDNSKYGIYIRAVNNQEISDWNLKYIYTDLIGNINDEFQDGNVPVFIYPNPFTSVFNIEFANKTASLVKIELLNILGNKLYTKNLGFLDSGPQSTSIQLNDTYSTGCYLVVVRSGTDVQCIKIVKSE